MLYGDQRVVIYANGDTSQLPLSRHNEALTDSGYGSGGTRTISSHQKLEIQLETIEEHESNPLVTQRESKADNHEDNVDILTNYSDTPSLQDPRIPKYAYAFADELRSVLPSAFDENDLERISELLPSLLQAFAVRLGHESSAPKQRHLMHLVYRYRQ